VARLVPSVAMVSAAREGPAATRPTSVNDVLFVVRRVDGFDP